MLYHLRRVATDTDRLRQCLAKSNSIERGSVNTLVKLVDTKLGPFSPRSLKPRPSYASVDSEGIPMMLKRGGGHKAAPPKKLKPHPSDVSVDSDGIPMMLKDSGRALPKSSGLFEDALTEAKKASAELARTATPLVKKKPAATAAAAAAADEIFKITKAARVAYIKKADESGKFKHIVGCTKIIAARHGAAHGVIMDQVLGHITEAMAKEECVAVRDSCLTEAAAA